MNKWYYIIFIAGLYFFNQAFQEYILMNGLVTGLIIGLIVAFICKFIFKMVTKTIVFIVIVCVVLGFLVSAGYIELPFDLMNLFNMVLV